MVLFATVCFFSPLTNVDKSDLAVVIFMFFGSTYWDVGAVRSCSTAWIRDEIIELFAVHSLLCARSLSVVQECLCAYSNTVPVKNIVFGRFTGYAFESHYCEHFAHIRKHSLSLDSSHPAVRSLSRRRCHSVTSSDVLAASQWCPRDILQQSSSCDTAASLRDPDRLCSKHDSPGMRAQAQVETIDRTLRSNYEWTPKACSKKPAANKNKLSPLLKVRQ